VENQVEEEVFEIDPQDLLLENAMRVVFKAAEMLDSEELTTDQLKDISGALRDATEIVVTIESACGCDHDHDEETA
jgi:hypothetical protein